MNQPRLTNNLVLLKTTTRKSSLTFKEKFEINPLPEGIFGHHDLKFKFSNLMKACRTSTLIRKFIRLMEKVMVREIWGFVESRSSIFLLDTTSTARNLLTKVNNFEISS